MGAWDDFSVDGTTPAWGGLGRAEWIRRYMVEYRKGARRPKKKTDVADRLLARADRRFGDVPDGRPELGPCWPFMGARNARGYGIIRDNDGKLVVASRKSLELALGRPIGEGLQANHHCDNPPCIRPRHLYEGTARENVFDMLDRGRHRGFETQRTESGEWPDEEAE